MRTRLAAVSAVAAGLATVPVPAQAVPPANDAIGAAVVITGLGQTFRVNTREATTARSDGECVGAASVWYTYTPATDQVARFSSVGSRFDGTLAVFSGPRSRRTLVGCDERRWRDAGVEVSLSGGEKYWIALSARARGARGVLSVYAPAAQSVEHTMTLEATEVSGQLWVDLETTCDVPATGWLAIIARQRVGDHVTRSYDERSVVYCSTTPGKRHVELDGYDGLAFVEGRVSMEIRAYLGDGFTDKQLVQRTIETASLRLNARKAR
ncbi:hypothetical protein EKO23_23180 [Nocardioides guangzhouensis]|uniref:LamG domain-containing protein n=1 Tax=Nocardioides guangzhouensis TaxID=2497878 RepID=A0A4Q4Z264_9ACTN|nr:hypothetical protein [Nocardioides guangzhouensis]RYP81703.1 hypothetical protein EKO23_23180 [Nocardioides guangzhouensis]